MGVWFHYPNIELTYRLFQWPEEVLNGSVGATRYWTPLEPPMLPQVSSLWPLFSLKLDTLGASRVMWKNPVVAKKLCAIVCSSLANVLFLCDIYTIFLSVPVRTLSIATGIESHRAQEASARNVP